MQQLRIKTLQYNNLGQLEEIDLGPAPESTATMEGHSFSYSVGGTTYFSCYLEWEEEPDQIWKALGVAIIAGCVLTALAALRLLLR